MTAKTPAEPKKGLRRVFRTRSREETIEAARSLALGFKGREVVLLVGELGAGKTVFAKGLASGLGLEDSNQVCSPSFTLLNIYQAKVPIFHFDLYRLAGESEILELGWEDFLGRGVIIVEWAEKLPFEVDAVRVFIEVEDGERRIITVQEGSGSASPSSRA
ncbi:MAG: tRNA (adenosine(37)-N6)-threonylcarbamoyltransferase complex ATPase subunit type 1 TsaE [Candidatus Aminicenantes bacterium RBG_13_63_10]|nr:MAG: tRNA (adenosine(37)-N6)-threonylcarbamoyltransferase complex ATPase subunit type 1 TsaE [Candidatus Aminicenantes bacterium RBG_13_63_10]